MTLVCRSARMHARQPGRLLDINEHWSGEEIANINLFGEELGLDFGKMDVRAGFRASVRPCVRACMCSWPDMLWRYVAMRR